MRRLVRLVAVMGVVVFAGLQLVPYGRDHRNPPVVSDAPWSSPEAESAARAACYACHSNETTWPWYSSVAPMSWLVAGDVTDGRLALNFSEWPRDQHQVEDAVDAVEDGEMPPRPYLLVHPGARLSRAERRALLDGLKALDGRGGDNAGRRGSDRGPG